MTHRHTSHSRARAQRGAAAIEFAFLFTIFFGVLYAILSYTFVTLIYQGLVQAAAEGARAAVRIDRTAFLSTAQYQAAGNALARSAVINALSWMPQTVRNNIDGNGIAFNWTDTTVPINTGNGMQNVIAQTITVRVSYNYAANPILPTLSLPGLGAIPNLSDTLVGASSLRATP
jgi:Flp pilus assembly protein TadG